jgi:hypothetical protein
MVPFHLPNETKVWFHVVSSKNIWPTDILVDRYFDNRHLADAMFGRQSYDILFRRLSVGDKFLLITCRPIGSRPNVFRTEDVEPKVLAISSSNPVNLNVLAASSLFSNNIFSNGTLSTQPAGNNFYL